MKLLPTLLLATTTLASPLTTRDGDATKQFHLKTSSQTNAAHTNLYVSAYHTGAGLNDAVLTKDAGSAASAVLNGTKTQFKLGGLDWGFQMPGDTNYAAWEPVHINAGAATDGFEIKDDHLQWSENQGFGGWLVCDWYHNAPQLFYLYKYMKPSIPSSCSQVELGVEYV